MDAVVAATFDTGMGFQNKLKECLEGLLNANNERKAEKESLKKLTINPNESGNLFYTIPFIGDMSSISSLSSQELKLQLKYPLTLKKVDFCVLQPLSLNN